MPGESNVGNTRERRKAVFSAPNMVGFMAWNLVLCMTDLLRDPYSGN